ncbi:MAG: PhoH family protein [Planctomycetes bacterium]|nr:PhoH family protein [Planctomycetota bacterium]
MKDPVADEFIEVESVDEIRALLGPLDTNTRLVRELFSVNVLSRDGGIRLLGKPDDVSRVRGVFDSCLEDRRRGVAVDTVIVADRLRGESPLSQGRITTHASAIDMPMRAAGMTVKARTPGQKSYWRAMEECEVVFGVGPAGTGKTYLAVARAVQAIKDGEVRRIVLVRPAVEAGEKLGFLPGDFQAKVNPYLRPLYDALHDLIDPGARARYLESDVIEVAPLAYMRGRTLNHAFCILDEAQNCTVPQMLMFLTRLGEGSRMVVTGDPSQIDLPKGTKSGLGDAVRRLDGVPGIEVVQLQDRDVVRHDVVTQIIRAYDKR